MLKTVILSLTLLKFVTCVQEIKYISELSENERCRFDSGVNGTCRKISECQKGFYLNKNNKSVYKVCKFGETSADDVICCPRFQNKKEAASFGSHRNSDVVDFKTCREEFLKFRNRTLFANHFAEALQKQLIPLNKKNCDYLDMLNQKTNELGKNNLDLKVYSCLVDENGTIQDVGVVAAFYAILVERGDRPNIAAIGWTQNKKNIDYKCGGSVITDRYIVTAAHCKFFNRIEPDIVRIGDRFLLTEEDDDIAQEFRIMQFISHPDYKPRYNYNDIAMIKTVGTIIFNQFVVPSCIDDLESEQIGLFTDWTVAGYGETEDRIPSNVLLELKVDLVSNEECNKTFESDPSLPFGIVDSQFCVKSKRIGGEVPDTCFGDSGSPLQFKTTYEVLHDDFNNTLLSSIYHTSTVLGIVSFGLDCGFNVPSVYTKLSYYTNWIKLIIKN